MAGEQLPPGFTWGVRTVGDHTQRGTPQIYDSMGNPLPWLTSPASLWDQYNSATSGSGLAQGTPLSLQQLGGIANAQEGQRLSDEASINDIQKEYDAVPDSLNSLYTNAAKRAGTYSQTGEFNAGLRSEVNQGTRGAQAALGSRLHALYTRLGRPMPQHLEQYGAGSQEQTVDNGVDGTVSETGGVGDSSSATQTETTPETAAPAEEQNAISSVQSTDGELTEEQKRRLAALQANQTST